MSFEQTASTTVSSLTRLLFVAGIDLPQPVVFSLAVVVIAGVLGAVLVVGTPSFTRSVSAEIGLHPDRTFTIGFLGFFGVLVVVSSPLIVTTVYEHASLVALAGIVSLPGLFFWGLLLAFGATLGALAVSHHLLETATGGEPSLGWALFVGALGLASSQLIPILGALVAMGLATVAIGAILRQRTDLEQRLFDEPNEDRTSRAELVDQPRWAETTSAGLDDTCGDDSIRDEREL
ncbi:hypothetical protein SAMN04487967_0878 [Natronorubrum sediminis]|uniref:DUF8173 domain-containing protein n=1 Tax=Natronorubrum sediminis TaxID=640943 RepID=A0A1H6FR34_9EURY|nr:hypothetical protein SAMN04487967_0878 [Natronorubrum sediminis]